MDKTVLVVDDDNGLQDTLQSLLEMEGYDVAVAGDGLEALQQLNHVKPSLILLDLMMPRMNGYEFARELQRRGLRSEIPIIVLTADRRARQKAEELGADAFLAKPFDVNELLDKVERLIH